MTFLKGDDQPIRNEDRRLMNESHTTDSQCRSIGHQHISNSISRDHQSILEERMSLSRDEETVKESALLLVKHLGRRR
jgi:hypothetical protein